MRNILHICPSLPDTTLYYDLITALADQDITQIVYVPLSNDKKFGVNQIEKNNAKTIYSNCFTQLDRFIYYTKRNKIFKDVENKVDIKKVDLVHAHYLFSGGGVALKIKQKHNIDYVVAVRNTDLNFFWSKMPHLRRNAYAILKNAKNIIFISPSSMNKFINDMLPKSISEQIKDKCIVIPNGLNSFWFDNMQIAKRKVSDPIKLLFAGSINKNKNIIRVINAVEKLRNSINISISIIGKGPLYKKIKDMCKVKDWISIEPWMKREELLQEYRRSHIFAMPSTHETFGLVYLEALSQGLPIIHSSNQGIDGFFNNSKFVRSVNSFSEEDIGIAIKDIIENYDSLEFDIDLEEFRWENVADKYLKIYNSTKE